MVTPRTVVRSLAVMALAVTASARATYAQQRATQVVTFRVEGIDQIAFNGAPSLVISSATAGRSASVRAPGGVWSVTTNHASAKITASIDEELPAGLTLSVRLTPPPGAEGTGLRALSATPVEVITNLSPTAARDLPLTYQLDATVTAGVVVAGTRTVVFTITGGM
ncbi:MAG: hypothetical protein ACREPM_07325 [Gemmatimonadaceae bacterium]